jgi:patched 1 protein
LCYSANIPTLDSHQTFIDQIFEKIFPCVIITPLDCFWEGAKLLGPDFPIQIPGFRGPMKWTNLNPRELLMKARLVGDANVAEFPFEILEGFMRRAGIGSGYQEKPCLDPQDPECPSTAPNKGSPTPPDVASILAQGCFGFAPRFMHWYPDLIIGGTVHNKSGHVVK